VSSSDEDAAGRRPTGPDDEGPDDEGTDQAEPGQDADPGTAPPGDDSGEPVSSGDPAAERTPAAGPARPTFQEPADPGGDPADESAGPSAGPAPSGEPGEPARRGPLVGLSRRVGFAVLGIVGFGLLAFALAYQFTPIPSAQNGARAEGSVFYYADGKKVIAKQGTNRVTVPISRVPEPVRAAVISAENRSFYNDPGVSLSGTTRALWSTLSGEQVQGGSTITQQMVRNYYSGLSQERTVFRKLKEIMVSLKVGREKNKDWILQEYLNTIYFGRNAYGIQAAAKAYYNTDVSKLTPEQGAYLAAAIQMPSYFADPYEERRAPAEQRWRYVIEGMVRVGAVKASDAAAMKFPVPPEQKHTDVLGGQVGYMMDTAKKELEARGYAEDEINRGGLKIVTTFDKKLMDAAAKAVKSNVPTKTPKKVLTGLVSVNPHNGEVVAFYGGRDYLERQLNSSFDSYAQAGSGFKPYVLAAALNDGKGLDTTVDGSSPQTFNGTEIHNDGDTSYGMVDLVTATQRSINTAYINLGREVGLDKVAAMAEKLGIPEKQLAANGADTQPTFPLGTVSVSPVQQAGAFATFAADGVYHKPHVIRSVRRPGTKSKKITERGVQAFPKDVAADAVYALSKVVEGGTGTAAQLSDREVAGKTGTTDKGRAIWFNGFIPQMATSVGIFRTDNKPLEIPGFSIYGGVLPAQIWQTYMTEATRDMPVEKFPEPSDIGPAEDPNPPQIIMPPRTREPSFKPSPEPIPTEEPTSEPEPSPSPPDPDPTMTIEPPPETSEPRARLRRENVPETRGGHGRQSP
jgi:membrane peptidoglycan carboxypeptidase